MNRKIQSLFIFLVLSIFFANAAAAQKIEYSRDASTLAVNWVTDFAAGDDFSQFLFYDAKTGKIRSSFVTTEIPNSLIFSNDSKTLVIGERLLLEKIGINERGALSLLENSVSIENLSIDRKFQDEINADFLGLALSPDGKTLYKLFPNFLNAYTFPELKFQPEKSRAVKLREGAENQNGFIGISRDGSVVVESEYTNDSAFFVIKESGKPTAKIALSKLGDGEIFPTLSATVSQNNQTLMIKSTEGLGSDMQIGFWDLKKRASLGTFSFPLLDRNNKNGFYPLDGAVISPDGKKAAVSFKAVDEDADSVSMIAIYDIASEKSVAVKVKNEDGLRFAESFAFSPDSKQLATLSTALARASIAAQIQIWDTATGKLVRRFE